MKHGSGAVDLLTAKENDPMLEQMGAVLDEHNVKRRGLDREVTKEAIRMIEEKADHYTSRKATVVYQPDWHKGIIGIIASRLVDRFYKPTVVLTLSNGKVSGSARSVKGLIFMRP